MVPRRTEAILFYSQFPDGSPDRLSLHAGCPVLEGEKAPNSTLHFNFKKEL